MDGFTDIKTWLITTNNIHVSDDWLSACLEFIQQETDGSLDSTAQLRSSVFEQWLFSDLSEIGEPTLPAGISNAQKVDLVSSFPLQLLSIVDVGFPLYGQKQTLLKKDNPNVNVSADKPFQSGWEPKPCRMLMLKLTDGHECVEAIEYKLIRSLHTGLPSGTKIIISGPLICRRGVMLLCEENVQVLGGEVDALTETNTPLSTLEAMMEKNRLDEGKTSSLKLSGKFIKHGSDEKGDLKCMSFVKHEPVSSWSKQSKGRVNSTCQIKSETKVEHQSLDIKQSGTILKQQENDVDFQWEDDDIDYDALLDDELNCLDDTPPNTCSTKPESPVASSSNLPQRNQEWLGSNKSGNQTTPGSSVVKSEYRSSAITPSSVVLTQFPSCKVEEAHFDNDLDAFDMDDDDVSFSPYVPKSESMNTCGRTVNQQATGKTSNIKSSQSFVPSENNANHSAHQSANSSPLSQLSNYKVKVNQPYQPQLSTSAINETYPSSGICTRKESTVLSSERKSSSPLSSSIKRSLPVASVPKKAKQSKIYEWGFGKASASASTSSPTPHNNKSFESLPTMAPSSSNINTSNLMTHSGSTSPGFGADRCSDKFNDNDKDPVVISSVSTTSSLDFSSPKTKDLPKAVIHPFTEIDRENCDMLPKRPFEYLSDLDTYQPGESVIVKAYISTLTAKLGCAGGQAWTLSCRINDGTACLDVDLDNKVLTELIGFSAQDSIVMRQKIKSDPSVKEVLMEGLSQCQSKLINISCLMKIVTSSPGSKPVVTQFIPFTADHLRQLQRRVDFLQH